MKVSRERVTHWMMGQQCPMQNEEEAGHTTIEVVAERREREGEIDEQIKKMEEGIQRACE